MAPKKVSNKNELEVWNNLYLNRLSSKKRKSAIEQKASSFQERLSPRMDRGGVYRDSSESWSCTYLQVERMER